MEIGRHAEQTPPRTIEGSMQSTIQRSGRIAVLAALALGGVGAFAIAATDNGRAPLSLAAPATADDTDPSLAELAFPDAPFGVDPIVTGPTSASLKSRQAASSCAEAIWPQIPVDCYPTN